MSQYKETINSDASLDSTIKLIKSIYNEKRYLQIKINTGKSRSLNLNALSHAWYKQISDELGEECPGEVKRFCKYWFGLPILRGDDEEFNNICNVSIDPLAYESRIVSMEILEVTSRMNTKQFKSYLDSIQKHYAGNVNLEYI